MVEGSILIVVSGQLCHRLLAFMRHESPIDIYIPAVDLSGTAHKGGSLHCVHRPAKGRQLGAVPRHTVAVAGRPEHTGSQLATLRPGRQARRHANILDECVGSPDSDSPV